MGESFISLPDTWSTINIGDLIVKGEADLQTGPFGTMLLASEYKSEGTPVVAVKNIRDNHLTLDEETPRVDEETKERLLKYALKTNDILFGRKGAVDRRALVSAKEEEWLQGSDCIRLRFLTSRIDARYVSYFLGSPQQATWMQRHAIGSTMLSLNQDILKRISFPLPPLPEQRKIATILSTWDEAITLTEQLIAALQRRKQALMQLLLTGQVRFQEFEGQEWEDTNIIEITQDGLFSDGDWIESKDQDPSGNIRLIQLADIGDGYFVDKSSRFINDETARKLNCTLLMPGDILIARMPDPIGRSCLLPDLAMPSITAVDIGIIRVGDNTDNRWLMYKINSSDFRQEILKRISGTTRSRIPRSNLGSIFFSRPNVGEQIKIADFLQTLDSELELLSQYTSSLQTQKRGLMQQLLTGAVRVQVEEYSF